MGALYCFYNGFSWIDCLRAEVQIVHIAGMAGLCSTRGFLAHLFTGLVATSELGVLAVVLALDHVTLGISLRQFLAYLGSCQRGLETGISGDELGLLCESRTCCCEDGDGGDNVLDVHGSLQLGKRLSGSAVKARLLPVGSCLVESHVLVCSSMGRILPMLTLTINSADGNRLLRNMRAIVPAQIENS